MLLVANAWGEPSLRKKDEKSSSLFQRFMAVPVDVPMAPPYAPYPPYMYDPNGYYYGYPAPGMMGPPPPPMAAPPQYYMENSPPMSPPVYYGYPPVPQQGPPPVEPPVGQPRVMYTQRQPKRESPSPPITQQVAEEPISTSAPTVVQLENPTVGSPVQVHAHDEKSEPNELKDKLSKALAEASKQMEKVSNSALAPNAFDDLIWKPSSSPMGTMSLSEESVPIDNHILNWRDLVGLPSDK